VGAGEEGRTKVDAPGDAGVATDAYGPARLVSLLDAKIDELAAGGR
jgi:hypothetical protein